MANVKISQLASAGSLAGTEVLPVVQGGTTKKVTVQAIADLAAGGGSVAPFTVIGNGDLGTNLNVGFSLNAFVPANLGGGTTSPAVYNAQVISYANLSFYASGGSYGYGGGGSSTTATNVAFDYDYFTNVNINGSTVVTHVSFPSMVMQSGGSMGMGGSIAITGSAITSISLPQLVEASDLNFSNTPSLQTLSCPSLTKFTSYNGFYLGGPTGLTSITSANFPALTHYKFNVYEPGTITTLNLPSVTTVVAHSWSSNGMAGSTVLTSFILPNVVKHDSQFFTLSGHTYLTTLTLGTVGILKNFGNTYSPAYLNFSGCALNEASVDGVLVLLASLDGTNGTTNASNGNIQLQGGSNAAPSSIGLAAKATLLARGYTISHN